MKSFSYRGKDYINEKYPIISSTTGNKYLVKIKPYYEDDAKYLEGCVVSLHKDNLFKTKVLVKWFENDNGKIKIENIWDEKGIETDYDYNLISMTKLIVNLYETHKKLNCKSALRLQDDYEEFKKWDGVI